MLTGDGVDRDHNQYFSQLIIAFKIMAVDMVALLVLILFSCSGFFVAFICQKLLLCKGNLVSGRQ